VVKKEKLGSRRKSGEVLWYFPVHEKDFPDKIQLTFSFFNVEFGITLSRGCIQQDASRQCFLEQTGHMAKPT